MKELDKVQFLNAPVSWTGLFSDALESFAQQFWVAQKQTEAFRHIQHRRNSAASTPVAAPQPACHLGHPPSRCRHFRSMNRPFSLGRLIPVQH